MKENPHDSNEKARREAEVLAEKIVDPDMQRITRACIADFYGLIQGRIKRGVYPDVIPFPPSYDDAA